MGKGLAICAGVCLAIALVPVLLIAMMVITGQRDITHYIFPSPDRNASLEEEVLEEGGATVGPQSEFFLVGGSFAGRVRLGRSLDAGWAVTNGWKDSRTLNICDLLDHLDSEPDPVATAQVVSEVGERLTYRISTECPAGYFGDKPPVAKAPAR